MAGNIRIDPDTMDLRANQYRSEADKTTDVISQMTSLLNQLQGEWEGEASRSYADRFNSEFKPNMEKARDMINEIADALNKTAQAMREQDASIASGWRA